MKSFTKLQILEVLAMQRKILLQSACPKDSLEKFDLFAGTFVQVLEGKLRPMVAKETILVPGFGFVPVTGTIGAGGRITFFKDDNDSNGGKK